MYFLIWFVTNMFCVPFVLNFIVRHEHKIDGVQKVFTACALTLLESYLVYCFSPYFESSDEAMMQTAGRTMKPWVSYPVLFLGGLIVAPIICKISFREGAIFGLGFAGMKFVIMMVLGCFVS